jgi:uncharacterized protein (TIGR00725 family)
VQRRSVIAIVGSGTATEAAVSNAHELGQLIAEQGWVLITGGRDAGVMKAANAGAKQAKESLTIGILPDASTEVSPGVDVAIVAGMGEARNNIIVLSADAVIACGVGDSGTASEVALAIKNRKPVILLDVADAARQFFSDIGGDDVHIAISPMQAIQVVSNCLKVKREEE